MATATCVIANDGRLLRPRLVRRLESARGVLVRDYPPQSIRTVIRPETARKVREAMEAVVGPSGTGGRAAVSGYRAAAKTGTAQKSDQHGYLPGRYYSSMVGFLPADAPRVVIAVALDEPENGYYAGTVVAPVFHSLAAQIATVLGIPPASAPPTPDRATPNPPSRPAPVPIPAYQVASVSRVTAATASSPAPSNRSRP